MNMNKIFESYLFEKHILVNDPALPVEEHAFETVFSLANLFGIRILSGVDKMPPEQRARAEQLLQVAFAEYFKEDNT